MQLSTFLRIGFITSIVLVLCINLWWIEIPEVVKHGYKLGQLASDFLMAYITGYTFHYLVDVLQNKAVKKNAYVVVNKLINGIRDERDNMFTSLFTEDLFPRSGVSWRKYDFKANKGRIEGMFFLNDSKYRVDMSLKTKLTNAQVFAQSIAHVDSSCEKIFEFKNMMDSRILVILDEISDHAIRYLANALTEPWLVEITKGRGLSTGFASQFIESLEDYFSKIERLLEFQQTHISPYIKK